MSLVGCGVPDKLATSAEEVKPLPSVNIESIPVPDRDSLALVSGDVTIRVGEDSQEAYEAFPKPKGAYDVRENPPVTADSLKTKGWSTDRQTFAVVSKQGAVVLALLTLDEVSKDTLRDLIAEEEQRNGGPQGIVPGQFTNYRFWDKGGSRLMVCDTMNNKRKLFVTVVIGHPALMDALRMNPLHGNADLLAAERTLQQSFAP